MRAVRQCRPGSARKGHRQDMLGLVPEEGRCCPPPDGFAIVSGARLDRRFQAPNTPPRQEPRTSIGIDFPQSAYAGIGNPPRSASSSGESKAVPAQGRAVTREVMELCPSSLPGAAGSGSSGMRAAAAICVAADGCAFREGVRIRPAAGNPRDRPAHGAGRPVFAFRFRGNILIR